MSVPVSLEGLRDRIGEYGPLAYLVTVGDSGSPHVVSVAVRLEDEALVVSSGRTSTANVAANPTVTLLWPSPNGGTYSLLVDGTASVAPGEALVVAPSHAVLHRLAGADGPNCLPVSAPAD